MVDYYTLVGKIPMPCLNFRAWALWYEKADRRVALTQVGPIEVSTIFLGLDHGLGGRPQIFETMCFGAKDVLIELTPKKRRLIRPSLDHVERYATWEEAEAGHARAVQWAQLKLKEIDAAMAVVKENDDVNRPR